MSWMAEMSSYRHLAELKRRYAPADAAARTAPEPEPEPEPGPEPGSWTIVAMSAWHP